MAQIHANFSFPSSNIERNAENTVKHVINRVHICIFSLS